MHRAALFLLPVSRVLAVCACIAGLVGGFFIVLLGRFICFDYCPGPEGFSILAYSSMWVMLPCVALEVLAVVTFVPYCIATGQADRAVRQAAVLLLGGLVGVAVLGALMLLARATLPLTSYGTFEETPLEQWAGVWGVALMVVAGTWSVVLAYLQWGR